MIAGRYELEREVGRGGMGAVWLGRDTVLGREVALKRIGLLPGATTPDLQRAEREARLAARLNHPHVVAVYDLVAEGPETWLVMEYVEGITLSALIKNEGPLALDEAAGLVRQAADALAAAHAEGIVHRDVKPSNMMVTPQGEVKLTDFGIARAEADASLTQTGLVTGSPAYLAPEVASGASATEASDVWSLGATLFHLLAGHTAYDVGENLMGALYKIVHEEPPRLADAGWLAPVLEHTMTRDPADRWSMVQVRDYLDRGHDVRIHPAPLGAVGEDGTRVLQPTPSEPIAVPPVAVDPHLAGSEPASPPPVPPTRRRRRSPWPWAAAAAVLAALVVIAVAALSSLGQNQHGGGTAGSPPASGPSSSSPGSASTTPTSDTPGQAQEMRRFIATYLATVTSDPHTTWQMLTPSFQRASGGFGQYQGYWRTIRTATPQQIHADPASGTVSYAVDYVRRDGSRTSDQVTLQLVRDGSSYLINGES